MSQTVITEAFEQWKAQQAANGQAVVLDEFVFANVPNLDVNAPIDRTAGMPAAAQIVYRQAVEKTGLVNENAVVYSVTLGADVGDFSFNWIGLTNKATGKLAMVVHAPLQSKVKNANGQQGNVLTRSFLMEYNGAEAQTLISTPAETWQIDFTARLAGMDEALRLANLDIYGAGAFFDTGFLVNKTGTQYFVTAGAGYVGGLRASLAANANITVTTKPVKVWADVSYHGTLTSAYQTDIKFTLATTLANYAQSGINHYVFALASIDANGVITDLRPKGSSLYLRRDKNLSDIADPTAGRKSLELGTVATKDVQTRTDDHTSGRVALVGMGGIGVVEPVHVDGGGIDNQDGTKITGVSYSEGDGYSVLGSAGQLVTFTMNRGMRPCRIHMMYDQKRAWLSFYSGETWSYAEVYTTLRKPSAGDVGALPANGTAVAADKLATSRKIAGVAFDGTKDIAIGYSDVGALASGGTAVAATKLATARKIAGVAFDGTKDIAISYSDVGALASDGTAVAASKLATARKIAGVAFDGTADIKLSADNIDALGSGAKGDVQTSLTDYTAGRIALVGMGGIGSQSVSRVDGGGIDAQDGALYSGLSYSTGDGYSVLGTSGDIVTFTMNRGSRPCRIHMKYDEKRAWLSFYGGTSWSYAEIYTTLRKPSAADVGTFTQAEITDRVNARGAKNTASKAARGWWKCGDTGMIYQWGVETITGETVKNFSFPVTFPNNAASLVVTNNIERTAGELSMTGLIKSTSQFSLSNTAATGRGIAWFAIGY